MQKISEYAPTFKDHDETNLMTSNKARESLRNIDGWQLTNDHKMIYREFIMINFMAAIDLIDRIAVVAENEKHHPDIHLTKFRNLRVALTTQEVSGLSEKDFTLALKINDLAQVTDKSSKAVPINQQLKTREQAGKASAIKGSKPKKKPATILASKKVIHKAKLIKAKGPKNRLGKG